MKNFERCALAVVALASVPWTSCAAAFPGDPRSDQRSNESVAIEIERVSKEPAAGEQVPAALAGLVTLGVEKVATIFVESLRKESSRYTAEYTGSVSADGFYGAPTSNALNVKAIVVRRFVEIDGKRQEALKATFALVDANDRGVGTAFRLVPSTVLVNHAKAKIADSRWYLPWTWGSGSDGTLDLDVRVVVEAFWVDKKLKAHRETIGDVTMPLRGITLGKEWKLTDGSQPGDEESVRNDGASPFIPLVPRSTLVLSDNSTRDGNGLFTIRVHVKEFDDYGKQVSHFADVASNSKGDLAEAILDALGSGRRSEERE